MDRILVTGASRGIGLAIAVKLAASGYETIALARRSTGELEAAIEAARSAGGGSISFAPFDLSEMEAIPDLARQLRREGPIYGLVNNAGISVEGLLATTPTEDIERVMRLNALAPIVLTKHIVRGMMADGRGRIVNLSSIVASTGYKALSVYAASKAAMNGFTRSLAREVGDLGITVNAIAPGFIDTDMTRGLDETQRRRIENRSALRRLASAGDVAGMAAFLIGESGRNITGAVMTVDAGSTA